MKGIVLAGGKGTRLGELTKVTNKHLLPVGTEPMIYHPIRKLVGAGIKDIMLVSGTDHMGDFVSLLGSGRNLGCSLTYRVQDEAGGIAQALGLCRDFAVTDYNDVVVLLGDNIFQDSLTSLLEQRDRGHPWIVIKKVNDPSRYGVAVIRSGKVRSIVEKPEVPPSRNAVTGIYVYNLGVFDVIKHLKPSGRGELEITDVNNNYIGELGYSELEGYWTDAGTHDSWFLANQLVRDNPPKF